MAILRLLGVGAVLLAATTARATVANDICAPSANPCMVTTTVAVDPGSTLDFGTRALQITASGTLNSGTGSMIIRAGSVVMQAGARLLSTGGDIDIFASTGAIQVLTGTSVGRIETTGVDGGSITLDAATTVQIDGDLRADGTSTFGTGGFIDVTATTITTGSSSRILSRGGRAGDGDEVSLVADGDLTIAGVIDVSGGLDGGTITLDGADITLTATGEFNLQSGEEGFGDEVDVTATGNVSFSGPIDGSAGGNIEFGGAGAGVTIFAEGNVTLNSAMELTGGGVDGEGGQVFIDTDGNIALGGSIHSAPDGSFGLGGDVTFNSIAGTISVKDVDVSGASGGTIDVSSNEAVTVTGKLVADGADARITVTGCGIDVTTAGSLSAKLVRGMNLIRARGLLKIQGSVTAGQSNLLEFRNAAQPPQITGPVVPATAPVLNGALPPCGPPPPPTTTTTVQTTTTTAPPATTTTTAPPVTTTTLATTTTTAPPVTTTTLATTTTTAPPVTTTTLATTTTTVQQTTTTVPVTTTSTTQPTVTTTTSSTSTTSLASTSTTTTSSSTTTTTLAPPCDPGNPAACTDGDTCTRDSCDPVAGCVHTPITTGVDSVTCQLGELLEDVAPIPADQLGGAQSKAKITRRLDRALRIMEKVRTATGRLATAGPKKARAELRTLIREVERGIRKGNIDPTVGNALLEAVRATLESLQPFIKRR